MRLGQSARVAFSWLAMLAAASAVASLSPRSEPLALREAKAERQAVRLLLPAHDQVVLSDDRDESRLAGLDRKISAWISARQAVRGATQPLASDADKNAKLAQPAIANTPSQLQNQQTLTIGSRSEGGAAIPARTASRRLAIPPSEAAIKAQYAYYRSTDLLAPLAAPLVQDGEAAWRMRHASDRPNDHEVEKQLQQALSYGFDRVQHCWQQVQLSDAAASGQMTLSLTLDRLGYVERVVTLQDTIQNAELNKCVYAAAKRVRTAAAAGERIFIELPLQFATPG